jgi:catechol 2,3-dioxygenase-like lactoylglutathione lyase family enzyme
MGHAVLMVKNIDAALAFYRDLLGFRISDYIREPITAYFMHVNPRHHSLALFEAPYTGMHHLMVELYSFDDVGQGYDIALGEKDRIVATLGRHPNDLVTSFYMHTPSDILIEYGWGGREVDDTTWQPSEMASVASFWGDHGLFDAMGGSPMPPCETMRAPLQVMDGNHHRMSGVCPWWDAMYAGDCATPAPVLSRRHLGVRDLRIERTLKGGSRRTTLDMRGEPAGATPACR